MGTVAHFNGGHGAPLEMLAVGLGLHGEADHEEVGGDADDQHAHDAGDHAGVGVDQQVEPALDGAAAAGGDQIAQHGVDAGSTHDVIDVGAAGADDEAGEQAVHAGDEPAGDVQLAADLGADGDHQEQLHIGVDAAQGDQTAHDEQPQVRRVQRTLLADLGRFVNEDVHKLEDGIRHAGILVQLAEDSAQHDHPEHGAEQVDHALGKGARKGLQGGQEAPFAPEQAVGECDDHSTDHGRPVGVPPLVDQDHEQDQRSHDADQTNDLHNLLLSFSSLYLQSAPLSAPTERNAKPYHWNPLGEQWISACREWVWRDSGALRPRPLRWPPPRRPSGTSRTGCTRPGR